MFLNLYIIVTVVSIKINSQLDENMKNSIEAFINYVGKQGKREVTQTSTILHKLMLLTVTVILVKMGAICPDGVTPIFLKMINVF